MRLDAPEKIWIPPVDCFGLRLIHRPEWGWCFTMSPVKVLLIDDHEVVVEGLRAILSTVPEFQVVGTAKDGFEAINLVGALAPDVIVLDLKMPNLGGIVTAREITHRYPNVGILVLTMHEDDDTARHALAVGARGYLTKAAAAKDLVAALRAVAHGEMYMDAQSTQSILKAVRDRTLPRESNPLSVQEEKVLRLLALGYSNKEISDQLKVSVKTIETYKSRGLEKLHVHSRVDLVQAALHRGWLTTLISADTARAIQESEGRSNSGKIHIQ